AAIEGIEADGPRHDRDHRAAHGEAAALFGEPGLDAAGGVQAERRAAAERNRIDTFHGIGRIEQRAFARAGPAAAHIDRGDRRSVEYDRSDTGSKLRVIGVADADAGNIGEEIFQFADPLEESACLIIRARSDLRYGLASNSTPESSRPWWTIAFSV